MKKIRIRAVLKSTGFKKIAQYHNDAIYENVENREVYLSLERDSYNLNTQLYGKKRAGELLLDYLQKGTVY